MSQGTVTGSEPSTYCSEAELTANLEEFSQQLQPRRSERLIIMEMNRKTKSPQLFEETESECSQIICGQMINTAKATARTKILRISQGPSYAKIKNEATKIVRLRQGKAVKRSLDPEEIQMPLVKRKAGCLTQLPAKQRNANPRTRWNQPRKQTKLKQSQGSQSNPKRLRPSKHIEAQEFSTYSKKLSQSQTQAMSTKPKEIQIHGSSSYQQEHKERLQYKKSISLPSSPSKLPTQYPAHFIHQLPPRQDQAPECLFTYEDTIENDIILSPNLDSLSSRSSSSVSDSIAKIFGTKDVNLILHMECPRKYYLLDDHLPAMAVMLGVEVDRLRSVINFTQQLTHEQLVLWPQTNNHQALSNENSPNL